MMLVGRAPQQRWMFNISGAVPTATEMVWVWVRMVWYGWMDGMDGMGMVWYGESRITDLFSVSPRCCGDTPVLMLRDRERERGEQ